MQVICLEDAALYELVEQVVLRMKEKNDKTDDEWISGEHAMQILKITSKTTLQKLRDEGKIRFSQPQKKIILYDRSSINDYLNNHARNTF